MLCPHTKLTYSPQGTVAMVAGKYAYYHYMQDNFNDTVKLGDMIATYNSGVHMGFPQTDPLSHLINPRRACAARVQHIPPFLQLIHTHVTPVTHAGLGMCLSVSADSVVVVQFARLYFSDSAHPQRNTRGLGCHGRQTTQICR